MLFTLEATWCGTSKTISEILVKEGKIALFYLVLLYLISAKILRNTLMTDFSSLAGIMAKTSLWQAPLTCLLIHPHPLLLWDQSAKL
jgi:hypothetical protein